MATETLNVTLEIEDCDEETLGLTLRELALSTIHNRIRDEWAQGGCNLYGYEGPFVKSVTIAHNGVEIREY